MKCYVDHIERVEEIEMNKDALPEGDYKGKGSGYEVVVWIEGWCYRLHIPSGIRGIDIPCLVHVKDGLISVSLE